MDIPVYRILFKPGNIEAESKDGELVINVSAAAEAGISRHCGGTGKCGKCRILAADWRQFLSPVTLAEKKLLKKEEIDAGIRLACCAAVKGNGIITVIDSINDSGNLILENTSGKKVTDWNPDRNGLGIAADIGTTTVVCYLLDLDKHKIIGANSFLNPQVSFGDDVISRIAVSSSQPETLKKMQNAIVRGMSLSFSILTDSIGAATSSISEIVVAGNTVMEHIFLGVSPESIGRSPYSPKFLTSPPVSAADLGFCIADDGVVKILPNIAGYVGADIVAGVTAHSMDKERQIRLFVDIGTNNELVIGNSDRMFCCATAAGPAFEGARISQGMRACNGAVNKVEIKDGNVHYCTIGSCTPLGLCGSGLIDAVAMLINKRIIDGSGRMLKHDECPDERIKSRLSFDERKMNRFLITDKKHPVYITQKDIREVQLAVGAVKVGIETIMDSLDKSIFEIDEILLAGAFGNNINIESAMTVGLLPKIKTDKVRFIFNASGLGACMALASDAFYRRTEMTMRKMKYIELSSLPDFQKKFVKSMLFN